MVEQNQELKWDLTEFISEWWVSSVADRYFISQLNSVRTAMDHGGSFLASVRELEGSQHVSQIDLQQDLSCVSVPRVGVETDEDRVQVSARRTYQGFEGLGHGSGRHRG